MGNVDQVRSEIDRGQSRDKVPAFDLAAAPLGTDDEAAGAGPSRSVIDYVLRTETSAPPQTLEDGGAIPYTAIVLIIAIILVWGEIFAID
jgi:hypothetical protein